MNHRFHDTEWVLNYAETVKVRRPEQLEVFSHISDHMDGLANGAPTVIELAPFNDNVTLYRADLNESDWPVLAGSPIHAVILNIAIHGSETVVRATYQKATQLLEPGGLLINADFVTKPEDDRPPLRRKTKSPPSS